MSSSVSMLRQSTSGTRFGRSSARRASQSLLGLSLCGVLVSGCAIAEQAVNDAIRDVAGPRYGAKAPQVSLPRTRGPVSYVVERESISTSAASRSSRDYGRLRVSKTERNPAGQTLVVLEACSHPQVGQLECYGHLFPTSPEGWLQKQSVYVYTSGSQAKTLAAGRYYLKAQNRSNGGATYYTTGELQLQPFVTNYVRIELE